MDVVENNLEVTRIQASDPDGDRLAFGLSGPDADAFSISTAGDLRFASAPNFELPTDEGLDNVYAVTVRVSDASSSDTLALAVTVSNDREGIAVRRIASGLNDITDLAPLGLTGEIAITERAGNIYVYNENTEQLTLDRTLANINTTGEAGLLGLAADPNNANIYWAFAVAERSGIFATETSNITVRQIRRRRPESLLGSGILLEIPHPTDVNYGGGIGFDPINRYLFLGVGDAGDASNAQDPNTKLGKILRIGINPDPFAGAAPAPFLQTLANNPFAAGGGDPFIYGLGVQNPTALSFDGTLLIFGDSGESAVEELNSTRANSDGENFGWPFFEGSVPFQGSPTSPLTAPASEYAQGTGDREGSKIISGQVYPGLIATLQGNYIFGDSQTGNIWSVSTRDLVRTGVPSNQYERLNADFTPAGSDIGNIVAIVLSSGANLYFADSNGDVFLVEAAD